MIGDHLFTFPVEPPSDRDIVLISGLIGVRCGDEPDLWSRGRRHLEADLEERTRSPIPQIDRAQQFSGRSEVSTPEPTQCAHRAWPTNNRKLVGVATILGLGTSLANQPGSSPR
jgi:hypothetical protein